MSDTVRRNIDLIEVHLRKVQVNRLQKGEVVRVDIPGTEADQVGSVVVLIRMDSR